MFLLIRRNLANRPARTLFTAAAIALGVSLIVAARLVSANINASAATARESRLAGADLEVSSAVAARFDERLAAVIADRPEVADAGPIIRVREGSFEPDPAKKDPNPLVRAANQVGTGLLLWAVDPDHPLVPYRVTAGAFLSSREASEVLLPANWAAERGLLPGSELELTIGRQRGTYLVIGLFTDESQETIGRPVALLPLGVAQKALGLGNDVDAILIRLRSGEDINQNRDALQESMGDQFFVTSASGGKQFRTLFTMTTLALPFASGVILLAGGFFVYNTFAMTLAERRREIGQLRLLGMTRRDVTRLVLGEALVVALSGSVAGIPLGLALGRAVGLVVDRLQADGGITQTPFPLDGVAMGLAAGLLITTAVTLSLARGAGRVSPLEAIHSESMAGTPLSRFNWLFSVVGLVFLLLAGAGGDWLDALFSDLPQPSYAPMFTASLLFALGALALLPFWTRVVLRLAQAFSSFLTRRADRRLVRAGITGQIALGAQAQDARRATLTAATMTISLAIVISLSGVTLFFKEFLFAFDQAILSADFTVIRLYQPDISFEEMAVLPSLPPMPEDFQADVEALSDVATISTYANLVLPGLSVESGFGDHYAFALEPDKLAGSTMFPAAEGTWDEAKRIFAAGPAIMLPELVGRRLDLHPGDTLTIDTLRGPEPFTVALVGGGFPIITPRDAALYFGSHPFGIFFDVKPGVDPDVVEQRVQAIVEKYPLEATTLSVSEIDDLIDGLSGPIVGLFIGLASLSGLVAALGIVVTLIASVLERQREFGMMRSLGMTRKQVRSVVVLEAGFIGLAGASLGAIAGLGMSVVFSRMMIDTLEAIAGIRPVPTAPIPWMVAVAALLISPLLAMLAASYPANRAALANPAEAMRVEGAAGFAGKERNRK